MIFYFYVFAVEKHNFAYSGISSGLVAKEIVVADNNAISFMVGPL